MNNLTNYLDCVGSMFLSHAYLDHIFKDEELERLESICDNLDLQDGITYDNEDTEKTRKSRIGWINLSTNNRHIFDKFNRALIQVNNDFFRFDLSGFTEIQYTEYDSDGSYYNWHTDLLYDNKFNDNGLVRKLSASFILSDPSEFQGGNFEIGTSLKNPQSIEQLRNRMIVFPSTVMHRVTPVTAGKRRSLVIWVLGPRFR